jgi:hypothetical protein
LASVILLFAMRLQSAFGSLQLTQTWQLTGLCHKFVLNASQAVHFAFPRRDAAPK